MPDLHDLPPFERGYEAGVDPLMAMKILGHTVYQTTANIYTHIRDDMLKKATVNMAEVFERRAEK